MPPSENVHMRTVVSDGRMGTILDWNPVGRMYTIASMMVSWCARGHANLPFRVRMGKYGVCERFGAVDCRHACRGRSAGHLDATLTTL